MKMRLTHPLLTRALSLLTATFLALPLLAAEPKKVLAVSVTTGFRHSSIETAEAVIAKLAKETGKFTVEYVQQPPNQPVAPRQPRPVNDKLTGDKKAKDEERFAAETKAYEEAQAQYQADYKAWQPLIEKSLAKLDPANLRNFDAVIFVNTTGDLPLPDKWGFINWIREGGAFIGTHSASDTFHGYPTFTHMIGGEFATHGNQETVECLVDDHEHPATKHLGDSWTLQDEIYLQKSYYPDRVHHLLSLDKHPNFRTPGHYPISWCKEYGKGRVFYTALGHREDVWESDKYQAHFLGGLLWALGLEEGSGHPQNYLAKVSPEEAKDGFQPLFNGVDLDGWHLRNPDAELSWAAEHGMLVNRISEVRYSGRGEPQRHHGTDLISNEDFGDFVLRYEYMIPQNSNSGVYLRGRTELQIFDDSAKGAPAINGNGAVYNIAAPAVFASPAPGVWQTVEATLKGSVLTVTLNGKKTHDGLTLTQPTGGALDDKFGQPGPIMLQGDHGDIAFRNVRIKVLDK